MTAQAYIGIDPDTKNTPVAVYIPTRERVLVRMFRHPHGKGQKSIGYMAGAAGDAAIWAMGAADGHGISSGVFVVEGQEIYRNSHAPPSNILSLATVAGFWAGSMLAASGVDDWSLLIPRPAEWKGQVPKAIHQARIAASLGWPYEKRAGYVAPDVPKSAGLVVVGGFNGSDWKHAMDAVGLAVWGSTRG